MRKWPVVWGHQPVTFMILIDRRLPVVRWIILKQANHLPRNIIIFRQSKHPHFRQESINVTAQIRPALNSLFVLFPCYSPLLVLPGGKAVRPFYLAWKSRTPTIDKVNVCVCVCMCCAQLDCHVAVNLILCKNENSCHQYGGCGCT